MKSLSRSIGSMVYHFINGSAFQCTDFAGNLFIEKKGLCLPFKIVNQHWENN